MVGLVYVLYNPSMLGLVKIGMTSRSSELRAKELRTTGVPSDFIVLWDEHVSDAAAVEKLVHEALAAQRVERDREFFRAAPKQAISVVMHCAAPFRVGGLGSADQIEMLDEMKSAFGNIFWPDIRSMALRVQPTGVVLRVVRTAVSGLDATTSDMDLGFISDGDEPWFRVDETVRENADRLLELDEYSIVMTLDVVEESHALRIDRAHRVAD